MSLNVIIIIIIIIVYKEGHLNPFWSSRSKCHPASGLEAADFVIRIKRVICPGGMSKLVISLYMCIIPKNNPNVKAILVRYITIFRHKAHLTLSVLDRSPTSDAT